jgi:hypothetical protein
MEVTMKIKAFLRGFLQDFLKEEPKAPLLITRDLGFMPFHLESENGESFIQGKIYGGPYRQKPKDIRGVKMAAEIKEPFTVSVPTEDFSTPDVATFKLGLLEGILHLKDAGEIYVGCMGGIGRTGIYMAGLAKIMEQFNGIDSVDTGGKALPSYICFVRTHYLSHAVETAGQISYMKKLDVSDIVDALRALDK